MKTIYELGPARLKIAIKSYMASIGKPLTDAAEFSVDTDGTVSVVILEPDDNEPVVMLHLVPISANVSLIPPKGVVSSDGKTPFPGHMVQFDPPYSVTGPATEFGYKDPTDNGLGFFHDPATGKPYLTNNAIIRGVSLPREVLLSTFLSIYTWQTDGIDPVWSRSSSLVRQWVIGNNPRVTIDSGGKSAADLPIVDAGPSAGTGNCIDLTAAVASELGTNGKAIATYMISVAGKPVEIRGWDFTKGKVG